MSETPKPKPIDLPLRENPPTLEQITKEKAPEILKDIPGDKRAHLARLTVERHEISMRAGPLPDPDDLAAYNAIIPDGADRILKMAEAQSAHRITIESLVVKSQQKQAFCGQLFGLIIGLSGLLLATYAAISEQPWFGSIIGGATLVSLVSVFLYTRSTQKTELAKKQQQMVPSQPASQVTVQNSGKNKKKR